MLALAFSKISMPAPSLPSSMPHRLVIASRQSRLALWQAGYVQRALQAIYPTLPVMILGLSTRGDEILDRPLAQVGGKGLFVKELESALVDGRADLAVHSLKDVPMVLPLGFTLETIPVRGEPRDALVCPNYDSLECLPAGSVVGTSSVRRQAMLRACHPHLEIQVLRGNVETRLSKLDMGGYDAIILAAAGLTRLKLASRIRAFLDPQHSLPAAGQGALGIEIHEDRADVAKLLAPLHHFPSALAVTAERHVARVLNGGCDVPLSAFAVWEGQTLFLRATLSQPDGRRVLRACARGVPRTYEEASALGQSVADDILRQGGKAIIQALMHKL
jgi:hydroxymethylbilane synthase